MFKVSWCLLLMFKSSVSSAGVNALRCGCTEEVCSCPLINFKLLRSLFFCLFKPRRLVASSVKTSVSFLLINALFLILSICALVVFNSALIGLTAFLYVACSFAISTGSDSFPFASKANGIFGAGPLAPSSGATADPTPVKTGFTFLNVAAPSIFVSSTSLTLASRRTTPVSLGVVTLLALVSFCLLLGTPSLLLVASALPGSASSAPSISFKIKGGMSLLFLL